MKLCGKPVARQQLTTDRPVSANEQAVTTAQGCGVVSGGHNRDLPGMVFYCNRPAVGRKLQFVLSRLLDGVAATIGHRPPARRSISIDLLPDCSQ